MDAQVLLRDACASNLYIGYSAFWLRGFVIIPNNQPERGKDNAMKNATIDVRQWDWYFDVNLIGNRSGGDFVTGGMIEVTQQDICLASPITGESPVSFALRRYYHMLDTEITVHGDRAVVEDHRYSGLTYRIEFPQEVQDFIEKFMRGEPVCPMEFEAKSVSDEEPVPDAERMKLRRERWVERATRDLRYHRVLIDIQRMDTGDCTCRCTVCLCEEATSRVEIKILPAYLREGPRDCEDYDYVVWRKDVVCDFVVDAFLESVERIAPESGWRVSGYPATAMAALLGR